MNRARLDRMNTLDWTMVALLAVLIVVEVVLCWMRWRGNGSAAPTERSWLARRRQVVTGLLVACSTWIVFPVLLHFYPSALGFPRIVWVTFVTVGIAATFCYFKGWLMAVRARIVTRLGVSLIANIVSFGAILQLTIAASYWPQWFRHVLLDVRSVVVTVNDVVLVTFAAVVVWAAIELILTEDPIDLSTGEPDFGDDDARWSDTYYRERT